MKKMKKYIFGALTYILPAAIVLTVYFTTPGEIILTENASYSAYPNGFVKLTSADGEAYVDTATVGTRGMRAELFGAVPIKSVQVSVVPERYITVSGEAIGVRLYSDGIMVVRVESGSGAKAAGIKKGDVITAVNGAAAESVEKLSEQLSSAPDNTIRLKRNGIERTVILHCEKEKAGYTAGMWVRDSTAGIGTMSYYDGRSFGALGHAICDSDTEAIVPLAHGTVSSCRISSVKAGASGEPGELVGSIGSDVNGCILINSSNGLYGLAENEVQGRKAAVATRFLVKEGAAEIICDIDGEGVKSYDVEIERVSKSKKADNKSMVIHVTDEELLAATGGIVQGMSGSPIIQNGRIAGAVTHVFVNDPTRGYGIFIETMLDESEKLK